MRRLSVMMLALMLWAGASRAVAGPVDCGPAPTVKCLADAIFVLAKTLPDANGSREHMRFAEQELLPGSIKTAVEYVVWDNADPAPWEDIEWIAKAGRFDRAIELAKRRQTSVERLGGLLVVATTMLDKGDTVRAASIVKDVERELPSIVVDKDNDDANSLRSSAGEIHARLGHTDQAARLIGGSGINSVSTFLALASKYPAAASLRGQAWQEAERVNEPYAWQLLVEDAVSRGDQADLSRAGRRISKRMNEAIDGEHAYAAIALAQALSTAGLSDPAAMLVKPWPQWIRGKDAATQSNTINSLLPILVALARDQEVETATHAVRNPAERSLSLSKAAEEYFRNGRKDIAIRFDVEALRAAESSPAGKPDLQGQRDRALHNLALARADHGDIQGALYVAGDLSNETKIREVTSYIVQRAIDSGHGPVAGPAIEAMEQQARAVADVTRLLQAANAWYAIGNEDDARRSLAVAMQLAEEQQRPLATDAGVAAELSWRLNGKGDPRSLLAIADKFGVNDPGAVDHLVEIMKPISPAVAVQLAGRQTDVERQIDELANVAIEITGDTK